MHSRVFLLFCLTAAISCNRDKEKRSESEKKIPAKVVNVPRFNHDSAYFFVKKQVDFGPRIPNYLPHRKAGDYFIKTFEKYGAVVTVQAFESQSYDGQKLLLRNIIASYQTEKQKRILLAAHWDTRPFADKDGGNPKAFFDGANDGASGVGILLEVARLLHTSMAPEVGVDIILFDGEDWGFDDFTSEKLYGKNEKFPLKSGQDSWWCLGSQYWSKNKHKPNYSAYYGILLDMVGGKNAQFYREEISLQYAPSIVEKIWSTAGRLGYANVFIKKNDSQTLDDHVFVNKYAKIPMVDVICFDPVNGGFGDFHHTQKDNMEIISKETLLAVGETVMNVVYYE